MRHFSQATVACNVPVGAAAILEAPLPLPGNRLRTINIAAVKGFHTPKRARSHTHAHTALGLGGTAGGGEAASLCSR